MEFFKELKKYVQDAMPGGLLNQEWTPERTNTAVNSILDFTPVVGDAKAGYDAYQSAKQGNYGEAALNGIGLLPFVPAMGGVVKGMENAKWAHGTLGDFDQFRTRLGGVKLMDGLGPHFGTPQAANERLQKSYGKGLVEGANIRPLDPIMNNPLTKKNGEPFSEAELQSYLQKIAKQLGLGDKRLRGSQNYPVSGDAQIAVRKHLQDQGYDGILYRNSHEDRGSISGIVFDPSQMQSAIK